MQIQAERVVPLFGDFLVLGGPPLRWLLSEGRIDTSFSVVEPDVGDDISALPAYANGNVYLGTQGLVQSIEHGTTNTTVEQWPRLLFKFSPTGEVVPNFGPRFSAPNNP